MKNIIKNVSIALAVAILLPLCFVNVYAADYVITDIALTPGRNPSELNFAWYSPENPASTVVQFALKSDMTGDAFPADKATTFVGATTAATTGLVSNKVTVTNLSMETEYVYRLGDGTTWSPVYNYTTHRQENFGFVFVGDPQIGYADTPTESAVWGDTLSKAVDRFPETSFIMSAGDQVQKNNIKLYNAFFSPDVLRSVPLAPAMGNHEVGNTHYSLHFNLPNLTQYGKTDAGGEDGDYYYTYGNTLFMVLNTNNTTTTQHNAFMKEAVASNPDAKWKVLMFHHSIYSTTDHYTGAYVQRFIDGMVPTIDELGIDMVLMGHDHVYVRTHLMKNNVVMSQQTIDEEGNVLNPNGTLYITGNSPSSSKHYDIQLTDPDFAVVNSQLNVPTFSYVSVSGRKMSLTTYRTDTMEAVDSFSMIKNNPVENHPGLSLDSFNFVKDGKAVDGIYNGDTGLFGGMASLSNDSTAACNAILAMAHYSGDKLVDLKVDSALVPTYNGATGGCTTAKLATPEINLADVKPGESVKLFLWNVSMEQLALPKEIKMAEEEPPQDDPNVFRYECENLTPTTSGEAENDVNDADVAYSQFNADGADDYIQYVVNFPSSGKWNISLSAKTSPNSGMFKLYLPQSSKYVSSTDSDQYSAGDGVQIINIGNYSFKSAGDKQLRFIVTGKNDLSGGYILQNDAIILTKVE